ncbi:MAG: hypothetical protein CFE26_14750 [Verrucomicrobiales bacterium VVV1]|nr:MAG: hypothetical protein CFE26_14750 [Verrucomicrobiales bacterium VVV1]
MNPLSCLSIGLLMAGSLPASEPELVDAGFLSRIRAEAANHHPSTTSARLKASAATDDVRAVRLWDDPTVGLSLMATERARRRDDGDVRLSFEQPIPRPGTYEATRAKAEALRNVEVEGSRSARLGISAEAAQSVIELALADEAISIQASQLDWLSTMAGNAKQRAANPDGSAVDSLRLEVEFAKETQVLAAAKRSRDGLAQRLNLKLGRSLETPWPTLKLQNSPPPSPLASSEIARIPYANPQVRAMRASASAAHAETRLADREKQPALSVGLETGLYSGGDFRDATVGLRMTLPWFNEPSYNAKVSAAQNRERSADQDIETTRLDVASKVIFAATEAANAAAQARAYSGEIHDRAVQATRAIESSWISSKATLTDLLEANRTLLSIRLEQRRFIAMQLAALEELNLLVPPAKPN